MFLQVVELRGVPCTHLGYPAVTIKPKSHMYATVHRFSLALAHWRMTTGH